jgi:hypothetical protein
MTKVTQQENLGLIADAMKDPDIAKVVQAYQAVQAYVPQPAAVPVLKSHVAAGGNAA